MTCPRCGAERPLMFDIKAPSSRGTATRDRSGGLAPQRRDGIFRLFAAARDDGLGLSARASLANDERDLNHGAGSQPVAGRARGRERLARAHIAS